MTSRKRILKAIDHEEPDRVPRDLGGTESSGMTAGFQFNLQTHLRTPQDLTVFEPYQYVTYIGDDLKTRFKIDTANLTPDPREWVKRTNPLGFDVLLPAGWCKEAGEDGATVIRRTFWGGGVDTQTVLNKGTPSEVMDAVRQSVDTLAPGGGFVFCQVHNIQPDVPPENVVSMFEALDQCGVFRS